MFESFFKSKESKVLLEALNQADQMFKDKIFYNDIKIKVAQGFSDPNSKKHIEKSLYEMKLSPHVIALYAIAANCFKMLSAGTFHIHRGAIDLKGNSAKEIFLIATNELVRQKYFTEIEAKEQIENLNSVIKDAG